MDTCEPIDMRREEILKRSRKSQGVWKPGFDYTEDMRKTDNKVCVEHVNLLLLRAFHLHLYVTFIKYILSAI